MIPPIQSSYSDHPRYKQDVGYRLSRAGLSVAYGQQVEFQGPIVQNISYVMSSSTLNITYGSVSSIELRNSDGFEVSNCFTNLISKTASFSFC